MTSKLEKHAEQLGALGHPVRLAILRFVVQAGALAAMTEVGIDLSARVPQKLTLDLAEGAQLLVTMGCGEACPVVPGIERDDWPLEDPKGKSVERVGEIRDEVRARVEALLTARGWRG